MPRAPAVTPMGAVGAASSVGILATGGTHLTMVPADLTIAPRTDITSFTLVTLDAGTY
jgi:hypothetical protein